MQLNLVFLAHALSSAIFAFLLLLFPDWVMKTLLGIPVADVTFVAIDLARLAGAYCVEIAVITWLGRTTASLPGRRVILISMFVLQSVGVLVGFTVHYPLARNFTILFYLIFALAYLYIWLFRKDDFMPVP